MLDEKMKKKKKKKKKEIDQLMTLFYSPQPKRYQTTTTYIKDAYLK